MRNIIRYILVLVFLASNAHYASARLKVGLVLGGGGARGAAQVGVLKSIQQSGVPIDYVVGTSIGGIVGGLYCQGMTPEQMETLFTSQNWIGLFAGLEQYNVNDLYRGDGEVDFLRGQSLLGKISKDGMLTGILDGGSIINLLDRVTGTRGVVDFDSLQIPFRCVAADINTLESVPLRRGNLAVCMRASMAIPIVFTPVNLDGRVLVDGGLINNLPCDVVRAMGADVIIAIDLSQEHYIMKREKSFLQRMFENVDLGVGLLNWLAHRPDKEIYLNNIDMADVYINPDLHDFGITAFSLSSVQKMIAIGEQNGQKSLPLLNMLNQYVQRYEADNRPSFKEFIQQQRRATSTPYHFTLPGK